MKCKIVIAAIVMVILIYTGADYAVAATSTAAVTLHVTIGPSSQLTLNDDSNDPNIKSGSKRRAGATANVRTGSAPAILSVAASNDSMGQTDIDPITGVTATASDTSGNVYIAAPATRDKPAPGAAAAEGCLASYSETFNWYLEKSWRCPSHGKDFVTVTYTLTSP